MAQKIRELREQIGKTQSEFAESLGVSHDKVQRWEKDGWTLKKLNGEQLGILADLSGQDVNDLLNYTPPEVETLPYENSWEVINRTKERLTEYLKQHMSLDLAKEISLIMNRCLRKPRIAAIGVSDVGKSKLLNKLLGAEVLPAKWTPLTATSIIVKHIDDRPPFIKDDVLIYKRTDNENTVLDFEEITDTEWKRWKETGICEATGGYKILKKHATRYKDNKATESKAVAFVNSDILKNCDLVDLPGFGTESDAEDAVTMEMIINGGYDGIMFLSRPGFLGTSKELSVLRTAIQTLPCLERAGENDMSPLANLLLVVTHADTVREKDHEEQFKKMFESARDRFVSTLDTDLADFFAERAKQTGFPVNEYVKKFDECCVTYSIFKGELRKKFNTRLQSMVELLPKLVHKNALEMLKSYKNDNINSLDKLIKEFTRLLVEDETIREELQQLLKNESQRKDSWEKTKAEIRSDIKVYASASKGEFIEKYTDTLKESFIVERINNRGFKNKKADMALLAESLSATMSKNLNAPLRKYSEKLKQKIENSLGEFEISINAAYSGKLGIKTVIPFNPASIFAAGLAGAATYGALAFWASGLGNLGGYIIVAKAVSILSALGISVGGTAAVMPVVSMLGGPITLFIIAATAVAAIAAAIAKFLSRIGWKKRAAESIINTYEKHDARSKYTEIIDKYWDETLEAFDTSVKHLDEEWQKFLGVREHILKNFNKNDIEQRKEESETKKRFLQEIPL